MAHKFTAGVQIDGKETQIPTIVPGNEGLKYAVEKAQKGGSKPRSPTKDEVDRAVRHFLKKRSSKQNFKNLFGVK